MKKRNLWHLAFFLTFLLGSHNGYLALWTEESIDPDRIYPYRISTLPPEDQKALRQGVRAENILELTQLLEDYLS